MIRPMPEHRGLGVVEDRRGAVDAEHAVVVQRERPPGHLRGRQRPLPGEVGELAQRAGQLRGRHRAGVVDHRYDEPARRLRREAEVDPCQLHDLLALGVDPGVQLGEAAQPRHDDAGHQRQHADAGVWSHRPDRVPGLHQRGRVGVDPGGRVGDLAAAGASSGRRWSDGRRARGCAGPPRGRPAVPRRWRDRSAARRRRPSREPACWRRPGPQRRVCARGRPRTTGRSPPPRRGGAGSRPARRE